MPTIERQIIDKKSQLDEFISRVRPQLSRPFGKLCGDSTKVTDAAACDQGFNQNEFNQWTQGFNQYGK